MKFSFITNNFCFVSLFISSICLTQISCKKYLDARSSGSLVIPRSVKELQGLLDLNMYSEYPVPGQTASDDLYFLYSDWATASVNDRNSYIWDSNTDVTQDWSFAYKRIFNANVVLNVIDTLRDEESSPTIRNYTKGNALYYRASNFYELAQLFSPQYSAGSASTGFGLPLRISPNINEQSVRSTVQQTYDRIIRDLKEAIPLLKPIQDSLLKTRPSKAAAYGLLARLFISMGNYSDALKYADSCLQLSNKLLNYNVFLPNSNTANPFKICNAEVIVHAQARSVSKFTASKVDSVLYKSYDPNDIRKIVFFRSNGDGTFRFKGNYTGSSSNTILFSGLTTAEMYLIRAECKARLNNATEAMDDLNILLDTRWKTGTYVILTATDATDALNQILAERRKELIFRPGIRWSNLRRLNLDNNYSITIQRQLNGQTYDLPPNDNRYIFLIPPSVIATSGIQQNPR